MNKLTLWTLPVLLLTGLVFGREDPSYDPALNRRPKNVTDLDYWLYRWKGSYYNGTVVFTVSSLKHRDIAGSEGEELCPRLANMTHQFSWDACLAVTQTEGEDERPDNHNPVDIVLTASRSNFTWDTIPYSSSTPDWDDLAWKFESVPVMSDTDTGPPNFNLSMSSRSGPPYKITGASHQDSYTSPLYLVQMNMSSCSSPLDAWWVANFISEETDDEGELGVTDPTLDLTFDHHSASIIFRSWAYLNTLNVEPAELVAGIITIEFLGSVDSARSDILNRDSEPSWTPTVGFANNSLNLDYGVSASSVASLGSSGWGLWVVVVGCVIFCRI